jgi:hypothetical protein
MSLSSENTPVFVSINDCEHRTLNCDDVTRNPFDEDKENMKANGVYKIQTGTIFTLI